MSEVRVHNLAISLDGFATGEPQTLETPFGHAGERLHEWMFATRFWNEMTGKPGGTEGADHAFAGRHSQGFGAEIMGAKKFGPPGWQDDPDWKGWWGKRPPFHSPFSRCLSPRKVHDFRYTCERCPMPTATMTRRLSSMDAITR